MPEVWSAPVRVDAELDPLGRTSLTVALTVRVGDRIRCRVRTTCVAVADGAAVPWAERVRALLG